MKTPHIINGRAGFPDPNFPFPEKPIGMYYDPYILSEQEAWDRAVANYQKAYQAALSHMTYFADEEQEKIKAFLEDEGFAIPLKDGPYPVEDFPPYEKINQIRQMYHDAWEDTTFSRDDVFKDTDYRTILRFTKQETKQEPELNEECNSHSYPATPDSDGYFRCLHCGTVSNHPIYSVEQETKEEPKTESQEAWVELSKKIVHAVCPHPKTGVSECEMRILKVVGEFEKEWHLTRK